MGCSSSRGAEVVDPSEKPEDRPKTASSTEEASPEDVSGKEDKDKDENEESS